MKNEKDIWHFPRRELAEKYLDLLKAGITHRITLLKEKYILISKGKSIYANSTIKKLERKLDKSLSASSIQGVIRKLVKLQLISSNGHGKYLVEAPGLAQWCIKQGKG